MNFFDRVYAALRAALLVLLTSMICWTFSMVQDLYVTQRADNQSILALRTLSTRLERENVKLGADLKDTTEALSKEATLRARAEERTYEMETVLKYVAEKERQSNFL